MTQDYVTRLQLQLREAALRKERRGWLARLWGSLIPNGPAMLAVAAAVIAALLVAVVAVPYLNRSEPVKPEPAPKVIANLPIADTLTSITPGFGSAWVTEGGAGGRVLRVEPRTGRAQASIPLRGCGEGACDQGQAAVFAVADAMWTIQSTSELARIDPRTNRVTARIRVPFNAGGGFPVPVGGGFWIVGFNGIARVDPRSNRVVRSLPLGSDGYRPTGTGESGGSLWISKANGRLERRDARSGALEDSVPMELEGAGGLLMANGVALVGNGAGVLARIDPSTGRSLWETGIGERITWAVVGRDAVLVIGKAPDKPRDQLWKVDPATGRVLSSVELPEFGANGAELVGRELWIATANGHILIVRV